jgi:cytochrome c oxidase subunit III
MLSEYVLVRMNNPISFIKKLEKLHPYQTLMYLGMFGSGLIFLFLTLAFVFSAFNEGYSSFKMPMSFIASTIVLLFSGWTVSKMLIAYQNEKLKALKNYLTFTFLLGITFTGLQILGWMELSQMGINFRGLPKGSFLYVLSGIHIFHLLGAMIFALIMVLQYQKKEKDIVQQLVLHLNPYEKMKIELFKTYWYFMDLIWLVLFFLFLFIL